MINQGRSFALIESALLAMTSSTGEDAKVCLHTTHPLSFSEPSRIDMRIWKPLRASVGMLLMCDVVPRQVSAT